jgi:hypothetical protein
VVFESTAVSGLAMGVIMELEFANAVTNGRRIEGMLSRGMIGLSEVIETGLCSGSISLSIGPINVATVGSQEDELD